MSPSTKLTNRTEARIRFSEVDSIGIVWHGNYVKYLEDGREAFGREYGLGYYDVFEHGLIIPVVKLELEFKHQVKYGEEIVIETSFVNSTSAKIIFEYSVFRKLDKTVVLTAKSIQVFLNKLGKLELINPDFYVEWKKKVGFD